MTPQLLDDWKAEVPAAVDPALVDGPRVEDEEEARIAVVDQAFIRKLGPDLTAWDPEALRFYMQGIAAAHHYYGLGVA